MTYNGNLILIVCLIVVLNILVILYLRYKEKRCSETEKKIRRLEELNLKKVQVIKKQELEIGTVIGAGKFGTVKIGKWNTLKGKKKVVAVKFLKLSDDDSEFRSMILKEIYIFGKLSHDNIIQFLSVYGTKNYYCLVMEHFEGTNIKEIEYKSIGNDVDKILSAKDSISHQICKALTYLHRNKICHGDMANLNNTLVSSKFEVKVLDFGGSEFFVEENSNDKNEREHGTSDEEEFNSIVISDKENTVDMLISLYTEFNGQYSYSSSMNRNKEFKGEIEKACFDKVSKKLSLIFDHYLSKKKLD